MRKNLAVAFATAAVIVLIPSPAEAKWNGASIEHHSPDAEYDRPFTVSCSSTSDGKGKNKLYYIYEGQHSDDKCPDEDIGRLYVHVDEQIACYYPTRPTWRVLYDRNGWHEFDGIHTTDNVLCVAQRD